MKKTLLLSFLIGTIGVFAQTSDLGNPESWNLKTSPSIEAISLDQIDLKQLKAEDAINDKLASKPYRVGVSKKVNYGFTNAGTWTQLPNGDRIWKILFHSKDAVHLSVNFENFYLPSGAKIHLYNDERTDLIGAYTDLVNNEKKLLGTWFVKGDKLWVEYFEPKSVKGEGSLNISNVIHGYRLGDTYQNGYFNAEEKGLNDSGNCNQDVDCLIGPDFDSTKDILKKGVGFLNMGDGFICSGSLVNNTAEDKTPFFLTADHCFERGGGGSADATLFTARFNWISPNPSCSTILESTPGPTNFEMNGANERARFPGSDMALVEFQGAVPAGWDVTFAGWDRSDTNPTFEVGIHHPSGDIMKVCRDDDGATKVTQFGVDTWDINGLVNNSGGNSGNATGWELGVTEGGSSGSPLFDQNGRIIGQLLGGLAACSGTSDNNFHDYYGRFATSWDTGTTDDTQLKAWLDPLDTNPMTLDTKENVLAVNDEFLEENINIFPNPSRGFVQIRTTGLVGDLKYEIYNVLGRILKTNTLQNNEIVHFNNLANDIYFMKITELESNKVLVKKIVLSR